LNKSVQTTVTTIVADNELSLVIELKDDDKYNSNEAMGLATYSNSESTDLSYASIMKHFGFKVAKLRYDNERLIAVFYLLYRVDPYYLLIQSFSSG
jgi:hypothetical protein